MLSVKRKFQTRYWMLRNFKKSGFTNEELVTVYTTMIRPTADYGAVVYHSSLSNQQDELIDNLQNAALHCIFGPGISGRKMRELAGIATLRTRREEMCDKFAKKCASDPLFSKWFPLKNTRTSVRNLKRLRFTWKLRQDVTG